ncbi:PREDICTED: uncharacterized protein LOC106111886 [Papilio polytes]|uniref:uncharacterized protein LOC106111886 n=1 Tax=Papilio polytes TaxID=76194 RepID=UPI0006765B67|nr:PREDICTED: uncharacterized protein LOC106111886 [Papilio polytes]
MPSPRDQEEDANLPIYVRVVSSIFIVSAISAFAFTVARLLNPYLFYEKDLVGTDLIVHYLICGMMVLASVIGVVNSAVMLSRSQRARAVTVWLLLDSLFEGARVVYAFVSAAVLHGTGLLLRYELALTLVQYLLDSYVYCQMILRH